MGKKLLKFDREIYPYEKKDFFNTFTTTLKDSAMDEK